VQVVFIDNRKVCNLFRLIL